MRLLTISTILALSFFAFAHAEVLPPSNEPPKVAFLYISPADAPTGWTRQHERGRRAASAFFGPKAQLDYFDNVPDSAAALPLMQRLAADGYDMFFATSILYQTAAINLAFEYPDVKIEVATGFVRADNLATYSARFYEGRYVHGVIAGMMTETNKIGFIASRPTPEVLRGINAAFLAARSVNPDVVFEITWLNSYYSPEREAQAALSLIQGGCDIIMQATYTEEPMKVAEEMGVFAFGWASEMREFGPNASLTSTIDHWGPYYISRIRAYADGRWAPNESVNSMASNTQIIGRLSDKIPNRVTLLALDTISKLRKGVLQPFTGPIRRQDGSGWLAAGETASESELLTMNFFVEGLTGIIPR